MYPILSSQTKSPAYHSPPSPNTFRRFYQDLFLLENVSHDTPNQEYPEQFYAHLARSTLAKYQSGAKIIDNRSGV